MSGFPIGGNQAAYGFGAKVLARESIWDLMLTGVVGEGANQD